MRAVQIDRVKWQSLDGASPARHRRSATVWPLLHRLLINSTKWSVSSSSGIGSGAAVPFRHRNKYLTAIST
jgi:hypothetical protein